MIRDINTQILKEGRRGSMKTTRQKRTQRKRRREKERRMKEKTR